MADETRESRRTKRFMPYEYASSGIGVGIADVTIDGESATGTVNEDFLRVELDAYSNWDRVDLSFEYEFRWNHIEKTLADDEIEDPPLEFIVVMRALDSLTRRCLVREDFDSDASYDQGRSVTVSLKREDLRGTVELLPFLVRREPNATDNLGIARAEGVRVAEGRTAEIVVDRRQRTRDEFLDVTFDEFSERRDLEDAASAVSNLNHNGETPVLWLNNDHPRVADVLSSEAPHGGKARLRDVFYDAVTPGVWKQLFFAAVEGLEHDGDTVWAWQDAVLERFLPQLYPDADRLARRHRVLDEVAQPGSVADLLRDIDRLVQVEENFGDHFTKASAEVVDS